MRTGASTGYLGCSIAAGDHDGDGLDDLVVGEFYADSSTGRAYILYSGARVSATSSLSGEAGLVGFVGGAREDDLGWRVASGGDLDGDGTDEMVIGAYGQDDGGTSAGAAYLLYGAATRRRGGGGVEAAADAIITGPATQAYLGYSVAVVRDTDGDGLDELVVGAYGVTGTLATQGAAYLFLGDTVPLAGTVAAEDADHTWWGTAANTRAGIGVYGVGDLDGDGFGDVGVHGGDYSIGGIDGGRGNLDVYAGASTPTTTPVVTIWGADTEKSFGGDAMSPGDLDGDGRDELFAGARHEDSMYTNSGAAYLFYAPLSGTYYSSTADAIFYGDGSGQGEFGGRMPATGGDLTGDGYPDLVAGAVGDSSYLLDSGAIYVWSGSGIE